MHGKRFYGFNGSLLVPLSGRLGTVQPAGGRIQRRTGDGKAHGSPAYGKCDPCQSHSGWKRDSLPDDLREWLEFQFPVDHHFLDLELLFRF
jgi:hypothetical protein